MPFANNQGIQIHYQVTGNGPPLVLQHGFSLTLDSWEELGYVEMLGREFRLILVDARGHGASDKPHEPAAYALKNRVSDIVSILDDLHIDAAHYCGYSMGGWIGFGMAKYASSRVKSLIIGGAQPYGRDFSNLRNTLRKGIEAWMAFVESWEILSPEGLGRVRNSDVQALLAAAQDRPDMSDILPDMNMPCLLFAGREDSEIELVRQCAAELPNATLLTFPDLDHFRVIARSDLLVPPLKDFLASS